MLPAEETSDMHSMSCVVCSCAMETGLLDCFLDLMPFWTPVAQGLRYTFTKPSLLVAYFCTNIHYKAQARFVQSKCVYTNPSQHSAQQATDAAQSCCYPEANMCSNAHSAMHSSAMHSSPQPDRVPICSLFSLSTLVIPATLLHASLAWPSDIC